MTLFNKKITEVDLNNYLKHVKRNMTGFNFSQCQNLKIQQKELVLSLF